MCCSAIGNSVNGTATHTTDSVTSRRRSAGAIGIDGRGSRTIASASAPSPTRINVMTPGGSASSPMSMNRNDDPQIPPTARNSDQSAGVNWLSVCWARSDGGGMIGSGR